MVDVAAKPETLREAVASAEVRMLPATLRLVESAVGARGKGDVLAVARLAGMMAAKRTADLIPLCHPVRLVGCELDLRADRRLPGVRVEARARAATGRSDRRSSPPAARRGSRRRAPRP